MLVFTGGRVRSVKAELGSLLLSKFLFGFGNQHFSFSFVGSFLPIATMLVKYTKTIPTPSSPIF